MTLILVFPRGSREETRGFDPKPGAKGLEGDLSPVHPHLRGAGRHKRGRGGLEQHAGPQTEILVDKKPGETAAAGWVWAGGHPLI